MRKELLQDSRFYQPPKAWVVDLYSENFICVVSANSNVDETHNMNNDEDNGEDYDIHF